MATLAISIHVPREGHDDTYHDNYLRFGISIHVPREGHDAVKLYFTMSASQFQSTCPARGTTLCMDGADANGRNFNPRAPRGARLRLGPHPLRARRISIHVPREGHDIIPPKVLPRFHVFQSTCPARGTTCILYKNILYFCGFQSTCPARGTTSAR